VTKEALQPVSNPLSFKNFLLRAREDVLLEGKDGKMRRNIKGNYLLGKRSCRSSDSNEWRARLEQKADGDGSTVDYFPLIKFKSER